MMTIVYSWTFSKNELGNSVDYREYIHLNAFDETSFTSIKPTRTITA